MVMPYFQIKGSLSDPHSFSLFTKEEVAETIGRVRASNEWDAFKKLKKNARELIKNDWHIVADALEQIKFVRIGKKKTKVIVVKSWPIVIHRVFKLGKPKEL
jgi:hypothetical protein